MCVQGAAFDVPQEVADQIFSNEEELTKRAFEIDLPTSLPEERRENFSGGGRRGGGYAPQLPACCSIALKHLLWAACRSLPRLAVAGVWRPSDLLAMPHGTVSLYWLSVHATSCSHGIEKRLVYHFVCFLKHCRTMHVC